MEKNNTALSVVHTVLCTNTVCDTADDENELKRSELRIKDYEKDKIGNI